MLIIFIVACIAGAIVIGAGRIILGWILPNETMARVDRAFHMTGNIILKLTVIAVAAFILYLVWVGFHGA